MAANPLDIKTADLQALYTKRIDMVFFEGWTEEESVYPKIFNELKGTTNNRTTQILAGQTRWDSKAELDDPEQQRFKQGPTIVTPYEPFAVDVVASREQIDDQLYEEISGMAKDAGRAGRETVEQECAEFIQSLYTGTFYDGKAAFAADHPNYGDVGGTQSNLAEGELNDANLKKAIILFESQKDEGNKAISSVAKKLIVPHHLQFVAATVLESTQLAGTNLNDKNVLPALQLVSSRYWGALNDKAWFLQGARHQLNHIWRVKPEFKRQDQMLKNHAWVWKGYLRHACELANWRHLVGSAGTTTTP